MPNYRYNTSENVRRNNCARTMQAAVPSKVCQEQMPCCEEEKKCDLLSNMPIAMAYVPWQEWRNIYEVEKGICCGTIFEELNKPFRGMGGRSR